MLERRRKSRNRSPAGFPLVVVVVDDRGELRRLPATTFDESEGGLGFSVAVAMDPGTTVSLEVDATVKPAFPVLREAVVRWCKKGEPAGFHVGVVYVSASSKVLSGQTFQDDLYELLEVSPNADQETINRIFRVLAARYHPDNRDTGDSAKFQKLVEAHRVLGDAESRAAFDVWHRSHRRKQIRVFETASVTTGAAAEKRKRAGVLTALYAKRIAEPEQPAMSSRDLENLLGVPNEHLQFALWYLKEGGYLARSDNGRYQITIKGVDLAESLPEEHQGGKAPLMIGAGAQ